ncbi:hypothetical protein Glove_22g202 [Diversispora epigaea]|uniref:CCDC174 alpha/beta GRSR domain-containing protein n=1 Tax=Diversispora epigaea TaxID=1348612 RepID=A0A397JUI8_9GLOM|nr:hypothetical protein Glove_22g202 [Diversispora epigaea]
MQDPNRIIDISGSSVIDLKAELFKQKEEFQKQKAAANNQPVSAALRKSVKKPGLWDNQNKGVNERSRRDELEIIDAPTLEASRIAMERKAKLYDQLIKTGIDDETLAEEILVDFDRKALENLSDMNNEENEEKGNEEDEDPWVEYIDEFGRTRMCRKSQMPEEILPTSNGVGEETSINSEEISFMEQEKNEWEKAALEELKNGPIHYDETKEIRTKGVGFYRFSQDEKEREEQLRALKEMRIETEVKRAGYTSVKDKRKAQLDLRMATIRAKKQKASVKNLQTSDKIIETNSIKESQKSLAVDKSHESINNNGNNNNVTLDVTLDVNALLSDIRKQVESQSSTEYKS